MNARLLLGENYHPERISRSYESCHTPAGDRCEPDAPESIAARAQRDKEREAVVKTYDDIVARRTPGQFSFLADAKARQQGKNLDGSARRETIEDAGYDAVKARRARIEAHPWTCAVKAAASAEAYDAAHAAGREAARNLDRLLAGNEARADFIAQQITDAVLRAVWGRRDHNEDPIGIGAAVAAVRKLEDDKAIEAAYASLRANPDAGRFTIARRAALAAVQAVRDLR